MPVSILDCRRCDAALTIHPECLPIPVPENDPFFPRRNVTSGQLFCLPFTRSMPGQLTLGQSLLVSDINHTALSEYVQTEKELHLLSNGNVIALSTYSISFCLYSTSITDN